MIKKLLIFIVIPILIGLFPGSTPVQAASGLTVKDSTATVTFPSAITFAVTAESNADITDVRLHYYVERLSNARVTAEIYLDIVQDSSISTEWSWDMRKTGGLPPGTIIRYWWTLKDSAGKELRTEPESLVFRDDRFTWKSVTQDNITLYWYEGSESFAEQLLDAASEGIQKLYENTGIDFQDPVELYIYGDSTDLQNAMIFPQTWTGGVAYPMYGKIAIGIKESDLDWGLRTIVHELTHLVIHRMTDNPYIDLPTWLDEGLAMYMEGPLTSTFNYYLNKFVEDDALFTVRSLVSPFSAYADQSYLSYAESYCIVEMLITRYEHEKIFELLKVLRKGTDYDEALMQVYGFDMDELNSLFMEYMEQTGERGNEEETEAGVFRHSQEPLVAMTAGSR